MFMFHREENKMKDIFKIINRGIVKGAIWIYCKVVYRFEVIGRKYTKGRTSDYMWKP